MRPSARRGIAVVSIAWVILVALLVAWNEIWAPTFVQMTPAKAIAPPPGAGEAPQMAGSFCDRFDASPHPRRLLGRFRHPQQGEIPTEAAFDPSGPARINGALMMDIQPVRDCTVTLRLERGGGSTERPGGLVALFARCSDREKPFQSGCVFEWDMAAGKQRLWSQGQMLSECAAPGDVLPHTMSFALAGDSLQASVDGRVVLTATDAHSGLGTVGLAGHGNPRPVFRSLEMTLPSDETGASLGPIDVGGPFAITEEFEHPPESESGNGAAMRAPKRRGHAGVHHEWFISSVDGYGSLEEHDGIDDMPSAIVVRGIVYCAIDSKNAARCVIRTRLGDIPRKQYGTDITAVDTQRSGSVDSLLVRVRDAAHPWLACYELAYNWDSNTLELIRRDQALVPEPYGMRSKPAGVPTILGIAHPQTSLHGATIWLAARDTHLAAGTGEQILISATDAIYPRGYVGFGSPPEIPAIFQHVEMEGSP